MKPFHRLIRLLAVGLSAITPGGPRMPTVVKFNEHAFARRTYSKAIAGGHSIAETVVSVLRAIFGVMTPRRIVVVAVLLCALALAPEFRDGALLAEAALVLPPEISAKHRDYDKVAGEAFDIQEKYKGKPMPEDVGKEFQEKCQEAEALWAEIEPHMKTAEERVAEGQKLAERKARADALRKAGKRVHDPTMPAEPEDEPNSKIAGYIGFSDYVVLSDAYQKASEGGFRASVQLGEIDIGLARAEKSGLVGPDGQLMIPLTREERQGLEERMEKALEAKSLVSIGAGVIERQRLSVEPKVTADDRVRIRDLVPVGQTSSASVSYIREESFTRAAAETTPGNAKPEAALSYTEQTATVRTIPAWIPVTTDQLADWPGLRGRIDNRLLYDIRKREAEQLIYGDGSAPNLQGILDISGTQDITADGAYVGANDVLEHIRLGIALVATAGYEANGLLIHPMDWFTAVVLKGTDDHYLGQVFMTADRQPRVWGLGVVEDVAAEATAGVATEARNLIVADWQRGCELLDRMQANVMIGLNSDDFTRNRRTLLAEERVAFPIYAPAAFAYKETRASAT